MVGPQVKKKEGSSYHVTETQWVFGTFCNKSAVGTFDWKSTYWGGGGGEMVDKEQRSAYSKTKLCLLEKKRFNDGEIFIKYW